MLLREGPETVAAVILEGVVGANGVFMPPAGYWKKIRAICDRHGVLLIADEVLSGFGRTGRWFAVDHDGVTPDLMTMAKGMTGGYAPGGAVVVTERIARHFDDQVLVCGLTSYAHPLVCEAIVAAIETLRDERLVEHAAALAAAGTAPGAAFADFARNARTSARCAASACCGLSSFARRGSHEPAALRLPWRSSRPRCAESSAHAQARQPGLLRPAAGDHATRSWTRRSPRVGRGASTRPGT